ncbi:MAG: hypothetical protein A2289_14495 [Deltaproteobacteria bacterium RIFOXYA12_FULL_58_15]|nr:MAG: hypothetical protein A2289_14495 [Deltaproteobacteria bacterium RIFOXYA12_FULL_58_15]OGR12367.1 MAG: hypothetical protein A2341_20575 [Deltaproteobacteria bacterium RIFOXYB12_FULL_58_9]
MAGRPGLPELDQLIFSHAVHHENDVECDKCHAGIEAAVDTSKSFTPTEEVCLECHDKDDNCKQCHTAARTRGTRQAHVSELGFSHQTHMERTKETGCVTCHDGIQDSTELPVAKPSMAKCLTCHNHNQDYAQARCLDCHPSMQRLPLAAVAEFDHSGDWMARHGMQARVQADSCQQCHTQSTCSECHSRAAPAASVKIYPEAVERELLHRGDWISAHAIEARADGDTCLRCHQDSGFCVSCHTQSGLTAGATNGRVPHPPGYANRGGQAFHGDEARVRIETCVACHDQGAASNCVECHKSGGIGGSPHPPGWGTTHERDDVGENPMCRTCHSTR